MHCTFADLGSNKVSSSSNYCPNRMPFALFKITLRLLRLGNFNARFCCAVRYQYNYFFVFSLDCH